MPELYGVATKTKGLSDSYHSRRRSSKEMMIAGVFEESGLGLEEDLSSIFRLQIREPEHDSFFS
jgi:hypothetical protein